MAISPMISTWKLGVRWLVPFASAMALWAVAQSAAAQDVVADAAEWSNYCDPDQSSNGACYVRDRFECIVVTDGDGFQGFCQVGNDPQFEEQNWPGFLCEDYEAGSDECYPVNARVTCYSQQEYGAPACPLASYDAGGFIRTPEVFVTGGFVVPAFFEIGEGEGVDEGGWFEIILGLVIIGVVGYGIVVGIGALMGGSGTAAATPQADPPSKPPRHKNRADEIDRVRPEDLKVTARAENWQVTDEIDVGIARPPEGG